MSSGSEIGEECEAFLDGRHARWLVFHGRTPPASAWVNQAAHAGYGALSEVAGTPPSPVLPDGWGVAARDLALLVVARADDRAALEELQRHVLVPLELDLARSGLQPALRPGELVELVRAVLS